MAPPGGLPHCLTDASAVHEGNRRPAGLSDPSCAVRIAYPCAAAPVPATPGRTDRHRLSRGGDCQANDAPHATVLVRTRYDRRTRGHVAGRAAEGTTKKHIVRCPKRFVVRDAYKHLPDPTLPPNSSY